MATSEYASESTRGNSSELTINPDGTFKEVSAGLDKLILPYGVMEFLKV